MGNLSLGVVSGMLMIFGGVSIFLQGIGWLPFSKNLDKQAGWLVATEFLFKIGGPMMIISGLLKIFISS